MDIFDADQANSENANIGLNDLVGEGRKYSDPDELAKAYANAEAHLRRLEADNIAARAKLDALQANPNPQVPVAGQAPTDGSDPNGQSPQPKAPPQVNTDDFRSQIREEIKNLSETERTKANQAEAAQHLVSVFGSEQEATARIKQRAAELGVSVEWLRDSAGRSPAAFYATMGVTANHSRSTPAPNAEVNFRNDGTPAQNFEYFDKLRRENPKLYFTADTQKAMMANARKMGADFYKR